MNFFGRKEEPQAPQRAVPEPTPYASEFKPAPPPEVRKESSPVSPTPFRSSEVDPRGTAMVGKAVRIVGQITTEEDLYVDGNVDGTIESPGSKVTIGPNGRVKASIRARDVVILGEVKGNVEALSKVDIRNGAKLHGDIKTERISIEDGADFTGSIGIVKSAPKPAASAPVQVSAPVVATAGAANPRLPGVESAAPATVPPVAPKR